MNTIEHQKDLHRFVLAQDGYECLLEYRLSGADDRQSVDFIHTYVPFQLRGKKLAEQLVDAGLLWAKAQGYQIDASCSYVKKFL
jgi:predicted GNAT family acetyltransferase